MKVVSFKTAKLANNCDYNIDSDVYYNHQGKLCNELYNYKTNTYNYPAPYQTELCAWLREEHGIHVTADVTLTSNNITKYFTIVNSLENAEPVLGCKPGKYYSTYEDAIETGLQATLEFLEQN